MRKIITAFFLFFFFLIPVKATYVDTGMEFNGTKGILDVMFQNENIINIQHFEVEGTGYVRIIYDDNSSKVIELEDYIKQNENNWINNRDFSSHNLLWHIKKGVEWFLGLGWATDTQKQIIWQLMRVFVTQNEHDYTTQMLTMRIEALENTLMQTRAEAYCQGKIEVMKKYNLTRVTCGNTTYYPPKIIGNQSMIIGITPM